MWIDFDGWRSGCFFIYYVSMRERERFEREREREGGVFNVYVVFKVYEFYW